MSRSEADRYFFLGGDATSKSEPSPKFFLTFSFAPPIHLCNPDVTSSEVPTDSKVAHILGRHVHLTRPTLPLKGVLMLGYIHGPLRMVWGWMFGA